MAESLHSLIFTDRSGYELERPEFLEIVRYLNGHLGEYTPTSGVQFFVVATFYDERKDLVRFSQISLSSSFIHCLIGP